MNSSMKSPRKSSHLTQDLLSDCKNAFLALRTLELKIRNQALKIFADLIEQNERLLLEQNQMDLEAFEGSNDESLYARLKLDVTKLEQVVHGVRDVASLPDPVGQLLERTQLDSGLVLDKISVPIGVIAIVFESRPDVIPQILSLALKSGNAVALKGGRESLQTNRAFMNLVSDLERQMPELPSGWAKLVDTREDFRELLAYPEFVDLVIPRGSNELVREIMNSTQIPVLGHAEGVCHLYIHAKADITKSVEVAIDSKAQYPAVCNALETLLIDRKVAKDFLSGFEPAAIDKAIEMRGCPKTRQILPNIEAANDKDWRTEHGNLTLSIKIVDGLDDAVAHISKFGSHHTDGILTEDAAARERFLANVDSACVMANASTRFADGFRFGMGAEVGISTAKTHARGPVGLEGLTIYKYVLRGKGQVVSSYVGQEAKPFSHKKLPLTGRS